MVQLLSKRPDMFTQGAWPGFYRKAQGVNIWDLDDNKYIDMSISGIGANVLGYCDPEVDEAVISVIKNGNSCSLNSPLELDLANLLCDIHPWADMVRFAKTGGESMSIAVRIARAHTKKDIIAFCGYHGWHDWYLSANLGKKDALGNHLLPGLNPNGVAKGLKGSVYPFRYNQIDDLKQIVAVHGKDLAAIVMEPIRNISPAPGFLEEVRAIADQTGSVLIFDEISSGFRLNSGGSHLNFGLSPDISVFSKALGNGYPISAIIGSSQVMESAQNSFISSTYFTEAIGFAAAIATVKKHIKYDVGNHLIKIGKKVQKGWLEKAESASLKIDIGGIPPLSHFCIKSDEFNVLKALFIQLMLEKGFLASNLFYSMWAHSEEHVDQYLSAVGDSFSTLASWKNEGKLTSHLKGAPSTNGFKRLT